MKKEDIDKIMDDCGLETDLNTQVGSCMGAQLYDLLIENGSEPVKKEEIDEMMDDCGVGDRFKYSGR